MRLNVHSPRNMNTFTANVQNWLFLKILEQKNRNPRTGGWETCSQWCVGSWGLLVCSWGGSATHKDTSQQVKTVMASAIHLYQTRNRREKSGERFRWRPGFIPAGWVIWRARWRHYTLICKWTPVFKIKTIVCAVHKVTGSCPAFGLSISTH